MGLVLGLIGGGGSILTVPILVYLMGVDATIATGYSLLIVGATAAFGSLNYFRQGVIELHYAMIFAIPSIIAVYLSRAFVMPLIPDVLTMGGLNINKSSAIMVFFSGLMLLSAVMMLKKAFASSPVAKAGIGEEDTSIREKEGITVGKSLLIAIEGGIVGLLTGVLGAGGGFLIIPALVLLLGMPMKQAVGTSLLIIALKSLIGFAGDLQAGIPLDGTLLSTMLIATLSGMAISTKIAAHISPRTLQKSFGIFTLAIALAILIQELM